MCVRLVQAWGMELDVFLSDPRLTFFGVLLNADGGVYGRFDARDVPALPRILEGALALHAKWPSNRVELQGKRAPPLPWRRASDVPALSEKFGPAGVGGRGCLRCHDLLPGVVRSLEREKRPVPERLRTPWPAPERLGLTRLPRRLGGQPILSWADVDWALYVAPDEGRIEADFEGGAVQIPLPKGWRNP